MINKKELYYEIYRNNPEFDDYFEINVYHKITKENLGYIKLMITNNGSRFMYDELSQIEYKKTFKNINRLIYLSHIEVFEEYRNQGIANYLMNVLFKRLIPRYLSGYKYCLLKVQAFNVQKEMQQQYNSNILIKFYESFGFNEIKFAPKWMVKSL